MKPRIRLTILSILMLITLFPAGAQEPAETPAPSPATSPGSPNLTVVRVQSLEALAADVGRLAVLLGQETSGDELLAPVGQLLGIADLSWVDRDRPLVAVLPSAAMMMGAKGLVAALPVTDPQTALDALGSMFETATHGEDGVHQFSSADGQTSVVAMTRGHNYLVIGAARNLVEGFDPASALAITELPPGSVAVDIFLEPVAPMALMGLQSGRMMMQQQMQQQAEVQPGEEGTEGDVEVRPVDPMAMQPMMDLYFDLFENIINNTSRLQLSFEVGADNVVLHKRLVPKTGSTLEGLLAAQKGTLPELASLIDPAGSMAVFAGQVTFTPAFLDAMRTFLEGYGKAMLGVAGAMEANEETRGFAAQMRLAAGQAGQWLDCYRGDFAGSYSLDAESGFRVSQVSGMRDPDSCKRVLGQFLETIRELPAGPDGKPIMEVSENALTYGGISALRYRMNMKLPEAPSGENPGARLFESWFSRGLVTFMGYSDELMIAASGSDAEAGFRALVDRISAKRGGGITAARFAPLRVGPGFFMALDFDRLLGMIAGLEPAEEAGGGLQVFLDALPEELGPVVFGARLDTTTANFDLAVPLGILEAIGAVTASEEQAPAAIEPQPEG